MEGRSEGVACAVHNSIVSARSVTVSKIMTVALLPKNTGAVKAIQCLRGVGLVYSPAWTARSTTL